jgi:hypothetical protein
MQFFALPTTLGLQRALRCRPAPYISEGWHGKSLGNAPAGSCTLRLLMSCRFFPTADCVASMARMMPPAFARANGALVARMITTITTAAT